MGVYVTSDKVLISHGTVTIFQTYWVCKTLGSGRSSRHSGSSCSC